MSSRIRDNTIKLLIYALLSGVMIIQSLLSDTPVKEKENAKNLHYVSAPARR